MSSALDIHKNYGHSANSAVTLSILSSGSKGNATVSPPPLNNNEETVPLEFWPILHPQISV